jgi:hypothetical protein
VVVNVAPAAEGCACGAERVGYHDEKRNQSGARSRPWPAAAPEEAVASLASIEEQLTELQALSEDDQAALLRSAEDVRQGQFATAEGVTATFERYRGR